MNKTIFNSIAVGGGAYGDEGKGRIVDEFVHYFSKNKKVILYRDNGGANAGHTVEVQDQRIALHQLPSGIFTKGATIVLGKGMVIHPSDLLEEIREVREINNGELLVEIIVDEMAVLALDTHRAFENILKNWQEGMKGSTGRGIGPAYADILYRHPLRARDLKNWNEEKIRKHYELYDALIKGLNGDLKTTEVNMLRGNGKRAVGSIEEFVSRLKDESKELNKYIKDCHSFLLETWNKPQEYAFVFEKSQAVGLDPRYGVYPDVTASDCTFAGILSSTEGAIDPAKVNYRINVIKGTYMSSVGTRKLPTLITSSIADMIRKDAHEYGATTKRPRDIAWLDLPALHFFNQVGKATHLALTHMDIIYPDTMVKVCIAYELDGKRVGYRPDQEYLSKVKPIYEELEPWSRAEIQKAKDAHEIPDQAKKYLDFVSQKIGLPIFIITTGPKREQSISLIKLQ